MMKSLNEYVGTITNTKSHQFCDKLNVIEIYIRVSDC